MIHSDGYHIYYSECGDIGPWGWNQKWAERAAERRGWFVGSCEALCLDCCRRLGQELTPLRTYYKPFQKGPELRALLYATLFRLLGSREYRVSLMVGLPVEVMAERAWALEVLAGVGLEVITHEEM